MLASMLYHYHCSFCSSPRASGSVVLGDVKYGRSRLPDRPGAVSVGRLASLSRSCYTLVCLLPLTTSTILLYTSHPTYTCIYCNLCRFPLSPQDAT